MLDFLKKLYKNATSSTFNILIIVIVLSILPLIGAYIMEFVFKMRPCILCVYQRFPFVVIIAFSSVFLLRLLKLSRIIPLWFAGAFIVLNLGISGYHIGIEQDAFKTQLCTKGLESLSALNSLYEPENAPTLQSCKDVKFRFLTLTLAQWNFIYCLIYLIIIIVLIKRYFEIRISKPSISNLS